MESYIIYWGCDNQGAINIFAHCWDGANIAADKSPDNFASQHFGKYFRTLLTLAELMPEIAKYTQPNLELAA